MSCNSRRRAALIKLGLTPAEVTEAQQVYTHGQLAAGPLDASQQARAQAAAGFFQERGDTLTHTDMPPGPRMYPGLAALFDHLCVTRPRHAERLNALREHYNPERYSGRNRGQADPSLDAGGVGTARWALSANADELSPDELRLALAVARVEALTHQLTGIPNKRAYELAPKTPALVMLDADSLKFLNDNYGYLVGDAMLVTIAEILRAAAPGAAFHISGDEFALLCQNKAEAALTMQAVEKRLAGAVLRARDKHGRVRVLRGAAALSWGMGVNESDANAALSAHKQEREAAGQRAPRGERPTALREEVMA